MALSAYIKQVFYAEAFLSAGTAGVSIGLGMTPGGKLAAFIYNNATNAICICTWPRQITADTSHMTGIAVNGSTLLLYVDGVRAVLSLDHSIMETVGSSLSLTVAYGDHAAIGGIWFGPENPFSGVNAHWVDLGQFAFWNRCLSDNEMARVSLAGCKSGDLLSTWYMYEFERISGVLDYAAWPASWRAGLTRTTYQILAAPNWEVGSSALDLIRRAADSVGGLVFISADGLLTYQLPTDRNITGPPGVVFSESDGTAIDATFAYDVDDNDIINKIEATARNGLSFEYSDAASIALYGERPQQADTDLLYPADILKTAARKVNRYKAPILRCPVVTVDVAATPDAMRSVFDLELGDVIGLDQLPTTAPAQAMTVVVESISWNIDASTGDWKVTFEVSPGSMYSHTLLNSAALDSTSLGG